MESYSLMAVAPTLTALLLSSLNDLQFFLVFRVFVRKALQVNVPVAIFFLTVRRSHFGNKISRVPFLEGPEKFSYPKNLVTPEVFYVHILKINRGFLHTKSFRRIHLSGSVFKYRSPNNQWLCGSRK